MKKIICYILSISLMLSVFVLPVNKVHIPEHPDGDSGNIRTRNRMHPDTLPASLIVK